jgi:hypothetical protein
VVKQILDRIEQGVGLLALAVGLLALSITR